MANFCIALGLQPSEYKALTELERAAFMEENQHQINEAKRR